MDFRFLVPTLALALAACSAEPPEPAATSVAAPADAPADAREPDEYEADDVLLRDHDVAHVVVKEAFVTASTPEENIDSPASWLQDGKRMLVASAKATDQLVVYDGDTGQRLRTVGGTGTALGQLQRPNGVATIDDRYLFVVERDNHRVQMFQLPDFTPLLAFGADALQQPYGLWVQPKGEGYEVLVSDAYMAGEDAQGEDIIPPLAQLDRRFRRYELTQAGGKWTARDAVFGAQLARAGPHLPRRTHVRRIAGRHDLQHGRGHRRIGAPGHREAMGGVLRRRQHDAVGEHARRITHDAGRHAGVRLRRARGVLRRQRRAAGAQQQAEQRAQWHAPAQRAHSGSSSAAAISRQSNAATPRSRCEA